MKRRLKFMAAYLALQVVPALGIAQGAAPVVSLDTGAVMGTNEGDTRSFKGIPFALPPVGELRWRAPQPAASWSGVRPATAYGPDCLQLSPAGLVPAPSGHTAEDCLISTCGDRLNLEVGARCSSGSTAAPS